MTKNIYKDKYKDNDNDKDKDILRTPSNVISSRLVTIETFDQSDEET